MITISERKRIAHKAEYYSEINIVFPSFLESKLFSGFSQDSAQLSIRLKTQQCFVIHEYTLKFQVFSLSYNIFYHSVIHDYSSSKWPLRKRLTQK